MKERNKLRRLEVDGKIILKSVIKWGVRVWNGFIWLSRL